MKRIITITAGCIVASASIIPTLVQAHGWTEYPPARQLICKEANDYNDPGDGTGIKNQACRNAFNDSGRYIFDQINEYSFNIKDLSDNFGTLETLKKEMDRDQEKGLVCSGGSSAKRGISLPSRYWRKTKVTPGEVLKLKFLATAAHNPSYWQIYLSNPGFDSANQRLTWDDVTLLTAYDDMKTTIINGKKYYTMDVKLPSDRSGDSVLLTRWQRMDSAGEGFYNCSDITFSGEPEPVDYLTDSMHPSTGDHMRLRIFDENGTQEIVDEQILISDENNDTDDIHGWPNELAMIINDSHHKIVRIGVLDKETGSVEYNATKPHSNKVHLNNTKHVFTLDIVRDNASLPAEIDISGIQDTYTMKGTEQEIIAKIKTEGYFNLRVELKNSDNVVVVDEEPSINGETITVMLSTKEVGHYTVTIVAIDPENDDKEQYRQDFPVEIKSAPVSGDYNYEYPNGIEAYKVGTIVKHQDSLFKCKPFPFDGWCRIYSEHANQFEPDVGTNWEDAWEKIDK